MWYRLARIYFDILLSHTFFSKRLQKVFDSNYNLLKIKTLNIELLNIVKYGFEDISAHIMKYM